MSRDSTVTIAAGCGLDTRNWDSVLRMGRLASIAQDWFLDPLSLLPDWYSAIYDWSKMTICDGNNSPPSATKIENVWNCHSLESKNTIPNAL